MSTNPLPSAGSASDLDSVSPTAPSSDATPSTDATPADATVATDTAGNAAADGVTTDRPARGEADGATRAGGDLPSLERESEIAADYLEELLDIADLDGDIDMDVDGDRASVSIVGGDLQHLVGPSGVTLDALQELTRLAVQTQTGVRSRLMLDVAGYRAGRRAELTTLGTNAAEQARTRAEPVPLEPMTPFERKIVHDAVAAAGLRSESEGDEPNRRVVVLPT